MENPNSRKKEAKIVIIQNYGLGRRKYKKPCRLQRIHQIKDLELLYKVKE